MRKRIVIGLVALVIVGGIAALLWRPWQSRLEYHKREYLRARDWGSIEQWLEATAPYRLRVALGRWKAERQELHKAALFKLGYVEERTFVLSNAVTEDRANVFWTLHSVFTNDPLDLSRIIDMGTNTVRIIGLPHEMPKWEEAIRKLDVPQ